MKDVEGGATGGPMFERWSNVGRDLPAACRRAGIERLTPNDLRRTCSTWLHVAGAEIGDVAGVLRHADTRMVERVYGRRAPDAIGASLRRRLGEPPVQPCAPSASCASPALPLAAGSARCDTGVSDASGSGGLSGRGGLGFQGLFVPRDGIEPPTRGFSIRPSGRSASGKKAAPRRLRVVA